MRNFWSINTISGMGRKSLRDGINFINAFKGAKISYGFKKKK